MPTNGSAAESEVASTHNTMAVRARVRFIAPIIAHWRHRLRRIDMKMLLYWTHDSDISVGTMREGYVFVACQGRRRGPVLAANQAAQNSRRELMRGYYRHTKIIATVGPATESPEQLGKLILAGLDVMRLNMAHGTGEWVTSLVQRIRDVSVEVQRHVAVMMDVKGPEIRTGVVAEAIELQVGRAVRAVHHRSSTWRTGDRRQLSRAAARRGRRRDRAARQRTHSHGSGGQG